MQYHFPRTLGQKQAKERLGMALSQNRFPHAILVHGEPGLGQHALLLDLAEILACSSEKQRPCSTCSACKAFRNAALDSMHYLIPLAKKEKESAAEGDRDGDEPPALGAALIEELASLILQWHEQPYHFRGPEKAMVRVPQTRELLGRLGYAQSGGSRIVLIPYLEDLNPEAANALLKTLEEPSPNVYFLIASEHRAALLPTLLSRCLHLGLAPLSSGEMEEAAEKLAPDEKTSRLLPFAEGSPGTLMALLEHGETLLEEASQFLAAATASDWRVFSEYASGPASAGLEETARLLQFLLRCVRLHHTLKANHPLPPLREPGFRWTARALESAGWDATLAGYIGHLEDVPDLQAFATYVENALKAVKAYTRPQAALDRKSVV